MKHKKVMQLGVRVQNRIPLRNRYLCVLLSSAVPLTEDEISLLRDYLCFVREHKYQGAENATRNNNEAWVCDGFPTLCLAKIADDKWTYAQGPGTALKMVSRPLEAILNTVLAKTEWQHRPREPMQEPMQEPTQESIHESRPDPRNDELIT